MISNNKWLASGTPCSSRSVIVVTRKEIPKETYSKTGVLQPASVNLSLPASIRVASRSFNIGKSLTAHGAALLSEAVTRALERLP